MMKVVIYDLYINIKFLCVCMSVYRPTRVRNCVYTERCKSQDTLTILRIQSVSTWKEAILNT
jgi:hypothetical protein